MIVDSIIECVRKSRKSNSGGFVKKDTITGRWYEVEKKTAREKVSHALRDASKAQRKREEKMKRHVAKLNSQRLSLSIRRGYTVSGPTVLSPSTHLYKAPQNDRSIGAIVSDDDDDASHFSQVKITFDDAKHEWEKSLQASAECFLKSGESEICFGIPMHTGDNSMFGVLQPFASY